MSAMTSAASGESKEPVGNWPRLLELAMDKAREFKFWRRGNEVYETKDSVAPFMTMREFVYYAIAPLDNHPELTSLVFEARDTDVRAADRLASYANDTRFPIRPEPAVVPTPSAPAP